MSDNKVQSQEEIQKIISEVALKRDFETSYQQEVFGYCPLIHSCICNGRRMILLGSVLIECDTPDIDWDSPSDFLVSYLKTRLGIGWFSNEIHKPESERHEIVKWYWGGRSNVDKSSAMKWHAPNGKALALLHLAYDLFILDSTNNLPESLINRLKNNNNFNGARYEVFVFATLLRAGFALEYEEALGQNGRTPECKAKHIQSGECISVEAKTRNVGGILGAKEGSAQKIRLYDKLKDAVDKNVNNPYVIFVDTNLPELQIYKDSEKIKKISEEFEKLEKSHPEKLPNLICVTNIPFHYGKDDVLPNNLCFGFINVRNPKIEFQTGSQIVNILQKAMDQYAFLPKKFEEANNFADAAIKEFLLMQELNG